MLCNWRHWFSKVTVFNAKWKGGVDIIQAKSSKLIFAPLLYTRRSNNNNKTMQVSEWKAWHAKHYTTVLQFLLLKGLSPSVPLVERTIMMAFATWYGVLTHVWICWAEYYSFNQITRAFAPFLNIGFRNGIPWYRMVLNFPFCQMAKNFIPFCYL